MARKPIDPVAFLSGLPLFRELDAATLARLAADTTRRPLKRGETLFRKGDAATGMFVVVYGGIRLVASSPARGRRLSGLVGPGASFGEPVMFLERPALVDAQASVDTLVLHVPKQALFDEIERSPKFARRMIAGLSRRIESLVRELDRQAIGSGTQRVIDYLLHHCPKSSGPVVVTLGATKAAIASQLALTPEHFSRILRDLGEAGLLSVEGRRIGVPSLPRLEAAARRRRAADAG
jgi:CRP-like cAMP-binding protein